MCPRRTVKLGSPPQFILYKTFQKHFKFKEKLLYVWKFWEYNGRCSFTYKPGEYTYKGNSWFVAKARQIVDHDTNTKSRNPKPWERHANTFHTVIKRKVYTGGQNYFILTNKLDLYAILQVNSYSKNRGVGPLNGGSQNNALVKKIKSCCI